MELVIKINNLSDFNILRTLLKRLGISFEEKTKKAESKNKLPISYAEKPDFMAMAGIWKNKNINSEQLRKEAWGNRL
jgi:hypothetical protein